MNAKTNNQNITHIHIRRTSKNTMATKKPGYVKTGTMFDNQDNYVPGPGEYDTAKYKTVTASDMGQSMLFSRTDRKIENNPAPNQYEAALAKSKLDHSLPNIKFKARSTSNSFVDEAVRKSCSVGPAAYNIPNTFSKTGAGTIQARHDPKDLNPTPGPGAYDAISTRQKTFKSVPSYSMTFGEKKVFQAPRSSQFEPDVGSYTINRDPRSWGPTGFKKFKGGNSDDNGVPGPGGYSPESSYSLTKKKAPSCSFGFRHSKGNHF